MTPPFVYVILVNYKNWQDTIECLESIFKLTYSHYRVIVVDNNSQNGSVEQLQAWANGSKQCEFGKQFYACTPIPATPVAKPVDYQLLDSENIENLPPAMHRLQLVASKDNLGFAGGNNIGIKLALKNQADYVWLLNNDTVVEQDTLNKLVRCFEAERSAGKRLGILGARLLYYHNPGLVQAILGRYSPSMATTTHIGLNKPVNTDFTSLEITDNDYVVGASMFVSADFVRQVGLMAEDYFLYYEELDWVKRGQRRNYEIGVCPDAKVYHKEGAAIGGSIKNNNTKSRLSDFYSIRNRITITKKYYTSHLASVYFSLIFVILNRIKRRQFSRLPMILKIILHSFK